MADPRDSDMVRAIVRDLRVDRADIATTKRAQADALAAATEHREISGSSAAIRTTEYALALPPPDMLVEYEEQVPGLREEIVKDWKAQRAHEREIEKLRISKTHEIEAARTRNERARTWNALILGVAGLLVVGVVASMGHAIPAAAIAALDAFGVYRFTKTNVARAPQGE